MKMPATAIQKKQASEYGIFIMSPLLSQRKESRGHNETACHLLKKPKF
jgi:hypothetical protein